MEVVLGEVIGRYQVRRLLGQGGMGQVYLARDTVLGRAVALKIVVGSLLHEARVIARLNHPNIVQLYDSGEHRGGIYLALEYVEGSTLRERLAHGPMTIDEALRHSRAIADALSHAHTLGVYHCDLKPSNVIVGRDGRVRVVDFGIARTADDAGGASSGTEAWMAPEQWAGAPLTARVDSWALGIVTAQLLTGAHPLGDEPARRREGLRDPPSIARARLSGRRLPPAIVNLIARALDPEPRLRPSAAEWKRVVDDILGGRSTEFGEDGPYPGLAAFDEQRAGCYFGREREIDEFLERLREASHLSIAGPSGAGKSSFLHAGVIPRLRARERWTVIAFRPGPDPVGALARHVIASGADDPGDEPGDLRRRSQVRAFRSELLETPTLLAARLATLGAGTGGRVLLAVDQLEEAFTQCDSQVERARFLEMLLGAADDPLDPVRVVFTIRDDFVGKVSGIRSVFVMHRLGQDELRRTITEPLARYHYKLDDEQIVDDLLAELGAAEVASLPLLQFACRTLWEGRDVTGARLRRTTYTEMGGLAGALARHAENALAELTPGERHIARRLLLQLVSGTRRSTVAGGSPAGGTPRQPPATPEQLLTSGVTRRSVARDQLVAATGPAADLVLDRLLSARLLVQRRQGDGESAIVEIAHESLLQTWSQLSRWVAESRDERRLLDELQDAASLWERRGARSEETWSHRDLATARHRAAQLELAIPPSIEAFLQAGEARHRATQRRRRVRYGMALAVACAVAIPTFLWLGRYFAREHLIRVNAGTVDLVWMPYDWVDGAPRPVALQELPELTWTLYAARPGNPHEPGEPIPSGFIEVLASTTAETRRTERVRAPGGTAFLKIVGRGRKAERCAPSWIRIQAFPGYSVTTEVEKYRLEVPTCQATRADVVTIEAGPFVYGGPGQNPSKLFGKADYTEPRVVITLPRYGIDRTEISNARFAPFARLEHVTGYPAPLYSNDTIHAHDADPGYPVSEINAFEAEAFCRYMGKHLPTDYQWVKAARGGLFVGGAENPLPERLYPWGDAPSPTCANQAGTQDGFRWVAPVDAFACGASPYEVINLGGNVQEWISREGQTDARDTSLHAARGGAADAPPELDLASTIFRNHRDPYAFDYSIGARCALAFDAGP